MDLAPSAVKSRSHAGLLGRSYMSSLLIDLTRAPCEENLDLPSVKRISRTHEYRQSEE
jgi:hypothetical protein